MPPRPKFELIIKGGEKVFAIDKPTSFGTAQGSTVRLKVDGQILPTHAVVEERDGVLMVQATGVTMVNGEPVASAELNVGSVLRIGRLELVVRLVSSRVDVTTQPEAQPELTDQTPALVPGARPLANPVMQAAAPRASGVNKAVPASGVNKAAPAVRASGVVPAVTAPSRQSGVLRAPAPAVRASGAMPAVTAPSRQSGVLSAPAPAVRASAAVPAVTAPSRQSGAISALGAPAPPIRASGAMPPAARDSSAISALGLPAVGHAPAARNSSAISALGLPSVGPAASARASGAISALGGSDARRSAVMASAEPHEDDDGGGHTMVRPSGRQNVAAEPMPAPVAYSGEEDFDASSVEPTTMRPLPTGPPGKLQPGDVIAGRYEIVAHLAEGGMGEVYRATHIELGRVFAIKVMKYELSQDPEFVERFKREAVASSRIGQQNIVDISDFGRTDTGRFYFVMEFLDGPTLAQLIARERVLYATRAVGIVVQIARALAAAHEQGIVHRDLKPENVIILQRSGQKDFVKVVDFGVAKVADTSGSGAQTALGVVVGTPQYMSPEQASGLRVDARSDIYSLGLIAWELIAGRVVFESDTVIGVMMAQMRTPAPPLVSGLHDSFVPPELAAIIMRMLEKEREARPQSMLEVVDVFEQFLFGALKAAGPSPVASDRVSGAFNSPPSRVSSVGPAPIALVTQAPLPPENVPAVLAPTHAPRSRWPLFIASGLVVVLLVALAFVLTRPPPQSPAVVPVKVDPVPPPEPVKVVEPVKPPLPAIKTVVLKITSTPDKAEVFDGDVRLGLTPFEMKWNEGTLLKLRVTKDGFLDELRSLSPVADLPLEFELKKKPVAPRPKPKPLPGDDLSPSPYN